MRGLVRETRLTTSGMVYPMFACPGKNVRKEVSSMPGVYQQSPDQIVEECREVVDLGIPGVILFGLPEQKDELAHGIGVGAWRRAARDRSDSQSEAQSSGDHRRLPVRIHRATAIAV